MRARDGGERAAGVATTVAATVVAALALAAVALLAVFRPLALVVPAGGLDLSWMAVLGEAATRPARWGVDLAFTYGPASALVTRYFTEGYLALAVPFALALALAMGTAFALLTRRGAAAGRGGVALILAAGAAEAAALASQAVLDQDATLFCAALTLTLLDLLRGPGERAAGATVVAGAALLGAAALGKTSFGVAAFGLFAIADARALLAWRRVPILVPVALAAALAAFLLLGQRLGDLPAYLHLQGEEATGYGAAMYLAPGRAEIAGYLGGSAFLVAVAALCGAPGRGGRLAAGLATAAALLLGLKAGFVRADVHTQIAWGLLGLAGIAVAAALVLPRSALGAAALAAASLAVLWVVSPLFLLAATDQTPSPAALPGAYAEAGRAVSAEVGAWARLARDPAGFAAEARGAKAAAWARVRAAEPLPALAGTVDILPSDQTAVLAAGLDYRPRPSFQEYSTYAPGLIAADLDAYEGPGAPDWVLWGLGGLDDRYPDMTEGALWPALLRRYEPVREIGGMLLLHRRPRPLPPVLGPVERREARFGAPVAVPGGAPVFARLIVRPTLLGRLAAALFRPPSIGMQVATADGNATVYRFIPALGAGGFLLSPTVLDAAAFADLGFGTGDGGDGRVVTSVTLSLSRWARLFYEPEIAVAFQPLTVPAEPPSLEARPLWDALAVGRPWRQRVRALGLGGHLDGSRLLAPAPAALPVPVAGARRLRVAFGIADGAWQAGNTAGVCFAVRAPADAPAPLWRRCLDPKGVAADRGEQAAEVDLPPGIEAVTAETACPKGCDWGWSYWSDIRPEEPDLNAAAASRTSRPPAP